MNSAFFEFNIANTALYAAKHGLSVTANNAANMATPGYCRQLVLQKASKPLEGVNGVGMIGTGTDVYGIGQVRDFYLDKRYWSQEAVLGEYGVKKDQLQLVETIFNELSDGGLTKAVENFFEGLSSLTFSSGDNTYRTSVINYGSAFAQNINAFANSLVNTQRDINEEIYAVTSKINSISDQLVSLNKQIFSYEIDGSNANDLRDQRALLVDELAQYANVDVREIETDVGKKYVVSLNGQTLVNHYDNTKLECVPRNNDSQKDPDDAPGLYDLHWKGTGKDFDTTGLKGELKGLFDTRDGNMGVNESPVYKGIPYYIDKLNYFAQTVAKAFNTGEYMDGSKIDGVTGHINGYDSNGNTGNLFFTYRTDGGVTVEDTEIDYKEITALNFSISDELLNDSSRLAASTSISSVDESNNEVILGFLKIRDSDSLFIQGNVFDYINGISSELGIDKKQSENFDNFYTELTGTTDNQRISVSGVSLNEEITNLIKYQQLFKVSAQLITAIDEVYDTIINGIGL